MNNQKICFKSDGTKKTGKRIIKELEIMGGVNEYHNKGTLKEFYYFIKNKNKCISHNSSIPADYTLAELPPEPSFPRMMWVWNGDNKEKGQEAEVFLSENEFEYPYVTKDKDSWNSFQHACELTDKPKPKEENVLGLVADSNGMNICIDGKTNHTIGWIKKDGRCYIMSHEIRHKTWEQWAKGGFKHNENVVQFMGQEYKIVNGYLRNMKHGKCGAVYNLKYAQPTAECYDPFVQKLSNGAVKIF